MVKAKKSLIEKWKDEIRDALIQKGLDEEQAYKTQLWSGFVLGVIEQDLKELFDKEICPIGNHEYDEAIKNLRSKILGDKDG